MLEKYLSFHCLAGACPSTCCAGWGILIDEQAYRRFEKLQPEWLRDDVLSNIQTRKEKYYFKNDKKGRCAMLDEDGLCRIQRNTSEEMLCNTCRKYPRLINSNDNTLYISMAASCPVISEYLLFDRAAWLYIDEGGSRTRFSIEEAELTGGVWKLYQNGHATAVEMQKMKKNPAVVYACFEKMAEGVLDIILQHKVQFFDIELFSVMEEAFSDVFSDFLEVTRKSWSRLVENYIQYRILSRRIEHPKETEEMCLRQIFGELFCLRMLGWCRYKMTGKADSRDYSELLQEVYRFAAHGQKVSEAFQCFLEAFFSQDILWNYVLL